MQCSIKYFELCRLLTYNMYKDTSYSSTSNVKKYVTKIKITSFVLNYDKTTDTGSRRLLAHLSSQVSV